MKIKIPATEREVCDICQHGTPYHECNVCGVMYCLSCNITISGCWIQPKVCPKCQEREDVMDIVRKFADKITPIIRMRTKKLSELRKK